MTHLSAFRSLCARAAAFATALATAPASALVLVLVIVLAGASASAQETARQGPPTSGEVQARLDEVRAAPGIEDAERATLVDGWLAVQALIAQAAADRERADALHERQRSAPADFLAARERASHPPLPALPAPDSRLAELTRARTATELARTTAADALVALDRRRTERAARVTTLPEDLARTRSELEAANAATTDPELSPRAATLDRARRLARIAALEAQAARLEADLASFDARGQVIEEQALAASAVQAAARDRLEELDARIQSVREAEAAAASAETRAAATAAEGKHSVLRLIASRSEALSKQRADLLTKAATVQADLAAAQRELADLQERRRATEARDELGAGTQTMGRILRRERGALPPTRRLERHVTLHARELVELGLAGFDLTELERALRTPAEALDALLAAARDAPPLDEAGRALGLELLEQQRRLALEVKEELDRTEALRRQLEQVEAEELEAVRSFRAFIDERVLWVRSTEPIWRTPLTGLGEALRTFLDPKAWARLPGALATEAQRNPGWALLYPLLVLALFGGRRALRRTDEQQDPALRSVSIASTFGALGRDVLSAALWPLTVGIPAYLLAHRTEEELMYASVASGALALVPLLFVLQLLRRLTRAGGTGELYFGWGLSNARLVRRVLLIVAPLYTVGTFISVAVHAAGRQQWIDTLGRYAFMLAMATALFGMHRLLRGNGLNTPQRYRDEESWISRLRPLWRLAGGGGALGLLTLSTLGFHYTARQLWPLYERSVVLMLAVLVAQAVAFRWLLLARRRIQIEQARARREADSSEGQELDASELPDLGSLGVELRHAVRAATGIVTLIGLYWVWRAEIPALGALDKVSLYPFGLPRDPLQGWPKDQFVFTPLSLVIVLLAIFATRAVAIRLPGLLDFLLLDRTGFTAAERYALRSITQYIVVGIGVMIALAQVGITWSQLQFLAAAVSVGLGFGLQEIFANFVSGLILLFERPIRVGDLVTVAGTEGRVTNIRIRATTILDFNRRELIVPNKEFVTGSVVNWTLSDPITRVVVPVGVAYGSDVELVKRLLMEAATTTPFVLADPPPHTVFRLFGESSLDFELRIYLGDRDHWVRAVDRLHARIDELFRENGVEIPFPQRDLHLRDASRLSVETFGSGRTAPGEQ